MHYLYIIYSRKADRYYIGETTDVHQRLIKHNQHYFSGSFTNIAEDWELKLSYEIKEREEALYLEKFIKRMKSRKFIEKIINYPEVLKDILDNQ